MKTPIRTWIWKDPIQVPRWGALYNTPRHLTNAEIDFVNANYFLLVNPHDRTDFYSAGIQAIKQLAISGMDWYFKDGFFLFTHESDRALVHLTMA